MNFTFLSLISVSIISYSTAYISNNIEAPSYFFQKLPTNAFFNSIQFENILQNKVINEHSMGLQVLYNTEPQKESESECKEENSENNTSFICRYGHYFIYALIILITILIISIAVLSFILCKKPKIQNFSSDEIENETDPFLSDIKTNDDPFVINSEDT